MRELETPVTRNGALFVAIYVSAYWAGKRLAVTGHTGRFPQERFTITHIATGATPFGEKARFRGFIRESDAIEAANALDEFAEFDGLTLENAATFKMSEALAACARKWISLARLD